MRASYLACLLLVGAACGDNHQPSTPDARPMPDAGPDAAVPDGIGPARMTADATGLDLPIRFVTVTYLKPQIGSMTNDPAGFTIQAAKEGPALFIAVDPATLTPAPEVGDVVSFNITELTTVGMQRRAPAIAGFRVISKGADVAALAQDISNATDVVSMLDAYDSELVTVTGSLSGAFASAGAGFQSANFDTAGITGDMNFKLRAPVAVLDAIDMVTSCQVVATRVPMGRFNAQAQLGVYSASDVMLTGCPAPVVASAVALSPTSVRITFSRNIRPASVAADGSQFTFDNGVAATAATVSGRTVTVTTSAQAVGTTYAVTVASSVTDLQGTAVATPDSATFPGFVVPAVVRINEVNANIASGCDLIELRVVSGGTLNGIKIQERNGTASANELSFTFPSVIVQTNDFIVVHLNSGSATCNPSGATQETTSPTEQPVATHPRNFDTAYDFWNADAGLVATDIVLTLFDAAGAISDAVFISNDPAPNTMGVRTAAAATETAAAAVGAANQWEPALATYIDDVFHMHAVMDLDATGTTVAGNSIQRIDNTDDNDKADWTTGAGAPSTWGALNPGQTPF
jgi:hypothetical protein